MIIRIGTAPRAAGTDYLEFQSHWRSGHGGIAARLPGLRSYLQNHAVLKDGRPLLPYVGFDACAEIAFDDVVAMEAAFSSDHYRGTVSADEKTLIDPSRLAFLLAERRPLIDAPEPLDGTRLLTFWRVCPGVAAEAVAQRLTSVHAGGAAEPMPVRHELLVEVAPAPGQRPSPFQVVESRVFDRLEEALAAPVSPAADAAGWSLAGVGQVVGRLIAHVIPIVERDGRVSPATPRTHVDGG